MSRPIPKALPPVRRSTALPDLVQQTLHVEQVPDLGEFAVLDAAEGELGNGHPATGRLDSVEDPRCVPLTVKCTTMLWSSTTMCRMSQCQSGNPTTNAVNWSVTAAGSMGASSTLIVGV